MPGRSAAAHARSGPIAEGIRTQLAGRGKMTSSSFIALGVNVDHVGTVRNARRAQHPDPVHAALVAEQSGADSITMHLREDRRHIIDRDVFALLPLMQTRLNLEMAVTAEMLEIALRLRPT